MQSPSADASAMIGADTNCSTRTAAGDGPQRQRSAITTVTTASLGDSDSTMQHLLCSVLQTAEAANQLWRQRDAQNNPQQEQHQQEHNITPGDISQQLLLGAQQPSQQQLHELLARLLSTTAQQPPETVGVEPKLHIGSAARQCLPQQQQHTASHPSASPVPRQLQHMSSLADSSMQDAVAAADALLDLETAPRDAGSFTRKQPPALASLLHRSPAVAAAATEGPDVSTPKADTADRDVSQCHDTAAAAAADVQRTSNTDTAAGAGATPRPEASSDATADAGAAAAAADRAVCGSGSGSVSRSAPSYASAGMSAQQQKVWLLLKKHLDVPTSGATQFDQQVLQELAAAAAGAAEALAKTAGTNQSAPAQQASTAAAAGAAHAALDMPPASPAAAAQSAASGGAAAADVDRSQALLKRLREHLAHRQAAAAAARASTAAASQQARMQQMQLRSSLSALMAATPAGSGAATGGAFPALSGGTSSIGAALQVQEGRHRLLRRCSSTLTNSTTLTALAPSHAFTAQQGQQHMAAAAGAAVNAEGPPCLDDDLMKMCADYQTNRKQVLAIIQEALEYGVLPNSAVRRLQLRQQHSGTDSPGLLAAVATSSGGAGGPAAQMHVPVAKRARDQQDTAGLTGADDVDVPGSKARRLAQMTPTRSAPTGSAAPAAKTASAVTAEPDEGVSAKSQAPHCPNSPARPSSAPAVTRSSSQAHTGAVAGAAAHQDCASTGQPAERAAPAAAAAGPADVLPAADSPAVPAANVSALLGRAVDALIRGHTLSKRLLDKTVHTRRECVEALSKAEQFSALTASGHIQVQQLQLQNQLLQHQLRLAQLQLQAQQQQLQQAQRREQHSTVAYPQLVARMTKSLNQLVAIAYSEHLPVADRQEVARIAEELLAACGQC